MVQKNGNADDFCMMQLRGKITRKQWYDVFVNVCWYQMNPVILTMLWQG
jgi:hypothetical protein